MYLPFAANRNHFSLTIDSNLVYFEPANNEIGLWSLGGNRKSAVALIDEELGGTIVKV